MLVRPLSTVAYTSVASVSHSRQWSNYNLVILITISLIPMTDAPETGAENRLIPAPDSGACVIHIWDQIRLVLETGTK